MFPVPLGSFDKQNFFAKRKEVANVESIPLQSFDDFGQSFQILRGNAT
jgi:hypothetical protein